jgi:hypothetical protein
MRAHDEHDTSAGLSSQIDTLGWGVLFVAVGVVSVWPDLPKDAWLPAAGGVMLGVSGVRAWLRLGVRSMTLVVGVVALAAGVGHVVGLTTATAAFVLIVLGVALLAGTLYQISRPTDAPSLAASQEGG